MWGYLWEKLVSSDHTGSGVPCVIVTMFACAISIPCTILFTLQVRICILTATAISSNEPASLLLQICLQTKAPSVYGSQLV
jgi:hypothetical protein